MILAPPQAYTKETMKKAFQWLESQEGDWTECIKDTSIVVRLYLNSKERGGKVPQTKEFQEELKKFCTPNTEIQPPTPANPIPITQTSNPLTVDEAIPPCDTKASYEAQTPLDSKSLYAVQKAKEIINLDRDEDALRVLIQVGYSTLCSTLR